MATLVDERTRLMALQQYDVKGIGCSAIFDALLQQASDISGVPGIAINLIDETCQINLALPVEVGSRSGRFTTARRAPRRYARRRFAALFQTQALILNHATAGTP